jgi:hypothetical protein
MLDSKSDDDIPAATAVVVADNPPLAVVVAANPPLANTIEYEAIPKLLFVDMQQEDEEKVAEAVTKLAVLLNPSNPSNGGNRKGNVDQALSLGANGIILLLMRKWHYNRSIQLHGCWVLQGLTCYNGDEWLTYYKGDAFSKQRVLTCDQDRVWFGNYNATATAVSIIKSGGIETIMAAMKSFPDDDDIQREGCCAISNAFYFTNPTIDEVMAHFVHKLNGIELVVPVMKKFHNSVWVQDQGCHVLQHLSRNQVLRDALKKGGALSAVDGAIEKHDCNNLQSAGAAFFKNMFEKNE